MMADIMPELAILSVLGVTGYFCRSVLAELKQIRQDLHTMAINHGERIARIEASY